MSTAQVLVPAQARLGECALWCEREQALYWTDIDSASLSHWRASDGDVHSWNLPERIGSFALCEKPGQLLLGLASGIALFDLAQAQLGPITPVEADDSTSRINDGRCDPQGRFVFGMFQHDARGPARSRFYRVGPDLVVTALPLPPAVVANSLAFSPDGRRLYFTDSPTREILCVDYHADGRIGTPESFAQLADDDGLPDGSAVDAAGHLWTALWGAACVVRLDGSGREVQRLPLPVTYPTCPAFGGPNFDRLFITSSRSAVSAEALAGEPAAGDILVIDGVPPGRPEHRFVTNLGLD